MQWVKEFYTKQQEWSQCYSDKISASHRQHLAMVSQIIPTHPLKILELGAGGGQDAVVAAESGHHVVAVELLPNLAAMIEEHACTRSQGSIHVIQGDFYTITLPTTFDVVCYWDGFGLGADEDQRQLLSRIANWLTPEGYAFIDVGTPWYWAGKVGRQVSFGKCIRRADFDAEECRMLDTLWLPEAPDAPVTQSLRCYSPADLRLLLQGTGLYLERIQPGGAYDDAQKRYYPEVPLREAMSFCAILRRCDHAERSP